MTQLGARFKVTLNKMWSVLMNAAEVPLTILDLVAASVSDVCMFTCGGFSESSAGYLSRRKTLENCKENKRQEACFRSDSPLNC